MGMLPIKFALVFGDLVVLSCTLFERSEPDDKGTDTLSEFGFRIDNEEEDDSSSEPSKESKWGTSLRRTSPRLAA